MMVSSNFPCSHCRPRINYELAKELRYDAGFGVGTYAEDVASFILAQVLAKVGQQGQELDNKEE